MLNAMLLQKTSHDNNPYAIWLVNVMLLQKQSHINQSLMLLQKSSHVNQSCYYKSQVMLTNPVTTKDKSC
jgi:hypothetical protein